MKKLLGFLSQKWVITLVGVVALALFVWFAGPLFAFAGVEPLASPVIRLVVILVLFVSWGAYNLRQQIVAQKTNANLIDDLGAQSVGQAPDTSQSDTELQGLKERFVEAVALLKGTKMRGRGGASRLYELPWYIIVGPPGSGKTTALENSGLKFPLAERFGAGSVKGVGGTRNCDWWFTDEAVLLDTAGRYALQDTGGGEDAAAWSGFLDLLRKYRRRRPINGIIVAISLSDLMQQTEYERNENAQAIRRRIQELIEKFGISFPVYVVLTKCDLVAGFMECFDEFGRDERAQVWGVTFPIEESTRVSSPGDSFEASYESLLKRLGQRITTRLHQERNVNRRSLILGFPQQMASLKPLIRDFMSKVFLESRYDERALLRGVYFASGTQEGAPIDRLIGSLSRTFGVDAQASMTVGGPGKSFFLTRLFSDVIFPEAEITGTSRRVDRRNRILTGAAYAAALLVTVGAALGLALGFARNDASIQRLNDQITVYAKESAPLTGLPAGSRQKLPALSALRNVSDVFADRKDRLPLFSDFGLYVGSKLGDAADAAYQRVLQTEMVPHVVRNLESQMLDGSKGSGAVYDALSVYLSLADPDKLDRKRLRRWMHGAWEAQYGQNAELRDALAAHLDFMLSRDITARPKLSEPHILAARQIVCRASPSEQILRRIYERIDVRGISDFRVDPAGRAAYRVFAPPPGKAQIPSVPGRFTRQGFKVFMQESMIQIPRMYRQISEVCRLKTRLDKLRTAELRQQVVTLYIRDYTQSWDSLGNGIALVPFTDMAHAVKVLDTLSGPRSPLRDLLSAIERNTSLGPPDLPAGKGGKLGGLVKGAGTRRAGSPGAIVERRYQPLHVMVRPAGDKPAPLEILLSDIAGLRDYMAAIAGAPDVGIAAIDAAKGRFQRSGKDVVGRVRDESARQVAPLQQVLLHASRNSWSTVLRRARRHLNAVWKDEVLPGYARLRDRFPLSKSSKLDARLVDFARFFRPNGIFDGFFKTNLKPFVNSRGTWQERRVDGMGIGFGTDALIQFRRAQRIKTTLFRDGAESPTVTFSIEPLSLDSRAGRFALTVDGQTSVYRHTPVRPLIMVWPGPKRPGNAAMSFVDRYGRQFRKSEEGDWAWFRILAAMRLKRTNSADRLNATFALGGLSTIHRITTDSLLNPFGIAGELFRFRAPGSL